MLMGQQKLMSQISKYNIDTFPRSVILIGEKGCGKHTLVKYLGDNLLRLPVLDISKELSDDLIDTIYRAANPSIYMLDLSQLDEKEQNIILKFIEEPSKNSFIIMLCDNKNFVLDTVLNRCITFEFAQYLPEVLKTFTTQDIPDNILKNILRTPGNVLAADVNKLNQLIELCDKIISKIHIASLSNTLTIKNQINFKDEYDKFDLDIFLNTLANSLYNRFLESPDINIYQMYETLENQRKSLLNHKINKELWFENLLIKLWRVSRHGY